MKKKIAIGIGVIIILTTLFINLFFQNNGEKVELTFNNIEALAEEETPGSTTPEFPTPEEPDPEFPTPGGSTSEDSKLKPTCLATGTLCVGVNSDGMVGRFPGLMIKI